MTETGNNDDPQHTTEESSAEQHQDVPPQEESPGSENAADEKSRPGGAGFLVWLALVLALASIGLASYPFWAQWLNLQPASQAGPSSAEFERLADRVDRVRQERTAAADALRTELDRLSAELDAESSDASSQELAERIDQLSLRLERLQGERNTSLGGIRSRLEDLESEVGRRLEQFELKLANVGGNLDRADHGLRTRLLLMELDSLFAIAQNQLTINGNADAAIRAWERALERITALDGAEFRSLEETAQREFRRLREYSPPNIQTEVEKLFAMADEIPQWPVKTIQPGQPMTQAGEDQTWRDRMGRVFGDLVRVESVDRDFIGPDEVDLAREQVRMTLQTAALAMVGSRHELAARLIAEAEDAVRNVFDTEAGNVTGALDELEEMASGGAQPEPPSLTESRAEIARLLGGKR